MNINSKENKRLNIAIVVGSFPTVSETFIINQITALIDKGHKVKIFAFHRGESNILHHKILNYKLIERTVYFEEFYVSKIGRFFPFLKFILSQHSNVNFKRLLQNFNVRLDGLKALNLQFFYQFKWILKEGNFDIIHAHFGGNGAYLAEMKSVGFLSKTKLITSFHGYDLTPKFLPNYKTKYRVLFKEADFFTVNTVYLKSLLQKITAAQNVAVLPVGLDTSEFCPKKIEKNGFHLLFVGRLMPLKGPVLALRILNHFVEKGYRNISLSIVGDGELCSSLNIYIQKHQLQAYVHLKGAQPQVIIKEIMQEADVLIMPGIYDENDRAETQGLVIQEAQAMELPVIVSDVGGMKYGMVDQKTGFVVKEKDLEGFVEKITCLIEDPQLKLRMGKAGREFVQKNYDSYVLCEKLEAYYYQMLSKE